MRQSVKQTRHQLCIPGKTVLDCKASYEIVNIKRTGNSHCTLLQICNILLLYSSILYMCIQKSFVYKNYKVDICSIFLKIRIETIYASDVMFISHNQNLRDYASYQNIIHEYFYCFIVQKFPWKRICIPKYFSLCISSLTIAITTWHTQRLVNSLGCNTSTELVTSPRKS